jgi:hypothetical protein
MATRRRPFIASATPILPRGRLQNLKGQKILLHKYARKIDQTVRGVLAGRETPLVLAAAEPLASIFRSVNAYPRLVDDMIAGSPDHGTDAQLADAALPILDRLYRRELEAAIVLFNELKPRRATTDVSYAAHAATAGAIDQLLVDLDAVIPGFVSDIDGSVTYSTSDDAETYSVVDEVARRALCTGAGARCAKGRSARRQAADRDPSLSIRMRRPLELCASRMAPTLCCHRGERFISAGSSAPPSAK